MSDLMDKIKKGAEVATDKIIQGAEIASDKISQGAECVAQKGEKFVQQSKLKGDITRIEKEIKLSYEMLGEKAFKMLEDGNLQLLDLQSDCNSIKQFMDDIKQKQDLIDSLDN